MPLLGPVETEPATTGIANLVPCISPQVNLINTGLTDSAIDRLDVRLTERGIVNPGSEHSPLHPVQLRSAPGWCYTGPVWREAAFRAIGREWKARGLPPRHKAC